MTISLDQIKALVQQPPRDTYNLEILQPAHKFEDLLKLPILELATLAWGDYRGRFIQPNGWWPNFESQTWERVGKQNKGFKGEDELAACAVAITTFMMARRGGANFPRNALGEYLPPNTESRPTKIHMDGTDSEGKAQDYAEETILSSLKFFTELGYHQTGIYYDAEKLSPFELYSALTEDEKQRLDNRIKLFYLTNNAVEAAKKAEEQEDKETVFLADSAFFNAVSRYFGGDDCIPHNIYFTDFFVNIYGDYCLSTKELGYYSKLLSFVGEEINLIPSEKSSEFFLNFDSGDQYYKVSKISSRQNSLGEDIGIKIYDERGRFFNNGLFLHNLVNDASPKGFEESIHYIPSTGMFMNYLLLALNMMLEGSALKASYCVRAMINAYGAFNMTNEVGGTETGRRAIYEQFVTADFIGQFSMPFDFHQKQVILQEEGQRNAAHFRSLIPVKGDAFSFMDEIMLNKYDLIRIHKGNMKGSAGYLFHWGLDNLDASERRELLEDYYKRFSKYSKKYSSLLEFINGEFNLQLKTEEQLDNFTAKLTLSRSTKAKKLTKRVGLFLAVSSKSLQGEGRGEHKLKYSEAHSDLPEGEGCEYKALIGNFIGPPGQSWDISDEAKALCPITTQTTEFARYSLDDQYQPEFSYFLSGAEKRQIGTKTWVYDFKSNPFSMPSPKTGKENWVQGHGVPVSKGQLIAKAHYFVGKNTLGYSECKAHDNFILEEVEVKVKSKGKETFSGPLQVKLKGYRIETYGKLRNAVKTIPVKPGTGKEVIYNNLNEDLQDGIENVLLQDGDKSRDNAEQQFGSVIHTMRHNPEGRELIKELNEQFFNNSSNDSLQFDPRLAFMMQYDELYKEFDRKYAQPVWLYERDRKGELYSVICEMYGTWSSHVKKMLADGESAEKIKDKLDLFWYELEGKEKDLIQEYSEGKFRKLKGKQPSDIRIFINSLPEEFDEETSNVLVFYSDNEDQFGCDYVFCQRALAYAANKEQENVRVPAKFELSSITQVLSKSPAMDVVGRVLATGICPDQEDGFKPHPEVAQEVMADGLDKAKRFSALKALYDKTPINDGKSVLPVVKFFEPAKDEEGRDIYVINPKIREIALKESPYIAKLARQNELTLKNLAEAFKNVVIDFGVKDNPYFNMLMPVIYDQEGLAATEDSVGGHIINVMKVALEGGNIENAAELCFAHLGRAENAYESLIKSEDARKIRGRMGVYSKVAANAVVPVPEIWVPYSEEEQSWYQYLVSIFLSYGYKEKDIDGSHGFLIRMPMPFPIGLRIRVIYPGDPRYQLFSSVVQTLINPLVAYIEAGDFDGDDRQFIPLFKSTIQLASVELIKTIWLQRTGVDALNPANAGDGLGDHYGQKDSGHFESLLTPKNLISKDHMADLLGKSTKVQSSVGLFHSLALHTEIANHVYLASKEELKEAGVEYNPQPNVKEPNSAVVAMHVYENPLGGYEEALYELLKLVQHLQDNGHKKPAKGQSEEKVNKYYKPINEITSLINKAGLNSQQTHAILEAAVFSGECTSSKNSMALKFNKTVEDDPRFETFLKVATTLLFAISKGIFEPFFKFDDVEEVKPKFCDAHLNLAIYYLSWNPELRAKLEEKSIALKLLREYIEQTLVTFTYSKGNEIILTKLLNQLGLSTKLYNPNIGRMYNGPTVYYPLKEDKASEETKVERTLPTIPEVATTKEVNTLVSNLVEYLPKSRFGIKEGYKGYLKTEIANQLNGCSKDQLAAIYRFFFGFSYKEDGKTIVNPLNLLTGAAGTGKSHVTEIINKILVNCTDAVTVKVGATGVATQNIGGYSTFNSLFGQQTGNVLPDGEFDIKFERENSAALATKLQRKLNISSNEGRFIVFIVDEISILSAHQLHVAIESARIAYNKDFGLDSEWFNFAFLLVGDPLQLAPVSTDEDKAEGKVVTPCYGEAKFINRGKEFSFPSIFEQYNTLYSGLYTVHRQGDDKDFAEALDSVAYGNDLPEIFHNCINRELSKDKVSIFMTNKEAQKANEQALISHSMNSGNPIHTLYHGEVRLGGKWWSIVEFDRSNETATLKDDQGREIKGKEAFDELSFLPKWAEPIMQVAVGQKFMLRQNDRNKQWVNGSTGVVKEVNENYLLVNISGVDYTVKPEVCETKEYNKQGLPVKEYRGFLGHSAYALTVQKTQGLTLNEEVEVNFNSKVAKNINMDGLVYVALSRVTSVENLSIKVDNKDAKRVLRSMNFLISADSEAVKLREHATKELKSYVENFNVLPVKDQDSFAISSVEEDKIVLTSEESKLVFHSKEDKFDLYQEQNSLEKVEFSELPESVQKEASKLLNLSYEAKRTINNISKEAWGESESLGYAEIIDDVIKLHGSGNKYMEVELGTSGEDQGDLASSNYNVNLGGETYVVVESGQDDQIEVGNTKFAKHQFEDSKQLTQVFKSYEDIESFVEYALNLYPESIDKIINSEVKYWFYQSDDFQVNYYPEDKNQGDDSSDSGKKDNKSSNSKKKESRKDKFNKLFKQFEQFDESSAEDYIFNKCLKMAEKIVEWSHNQYSYIKKVWDYSYFLEYKECQDKDSAKDVSVDTVSSLFRGIFKEICPKFYICLASPQMAIDIPSIEYEVYDQFFDVWNGKQKVFDEYADEDCFPLGAEFKYTSIPEDYFTTRLKELKNSSCWEYQKDNIYKAIKFMHSFIKKWDVPSLFSYYKENGDFKGLNEESLGILDMFNTSSEREEASYTYAGIGSRSTPEDTKDKMTKIAKSLSKEGYALYSGGATGADTAFEQGAGNKLIFYPNDKDYRVFYTDGVKNYDYDSALWKQAEEKVKEIHPNPSALGKGAWKFHTRNIFQVLGSDLQNPVDFVVCWTPDGEEDGKKAGGTRTAIKLARKEGIPVCNLAVEDWEEFRKRELKQ